MYYELALISLLITAGYWGLLVIYSKQSWLHGLMQIGIAIAAALGLYHNRLGGAAWLGVVGVVGLGAGACLLLISPLVRAIAHRFAAAERFTIAQRLIAIADRLAPGSGSVQEKAFVATMSAVRDGNIDKSVETMTAARQQALPEMRRVFDERIALLYLAAYRWDEAIAHAEANLFSSVTSSADEVVSSPSLRRALGTALPVWVKLIGAYGYIGNLDRAARMLARLEEVCSGRDDAAIWIHRGRLTFLALAGRVVAVEALVTSPSAKYMSRNARAYWIAVAHEHNGEAAAAEAAYAKARVHTRGARRALIDRAVERLCKVQPVELPPFAKAIVDQVELQTPPVFQLRERPRVPWATLFLTASVLGVASAITLTVGSTSDLGVLVRAGAMVRGLVHDGEWWRIVSCNFIHVGGWHLLVNTVGLWVLARECEHLFGMSRTVAVFALAGIAGFIVSYLASSVRVSAGASGAIFGLLGAVFVEVTLHKRHHRAAWSRGMWGSLALIVVGQVGIDMCSHATDHYAHGGGALIGALLGAALSPHARWAKVSLWVSRGIAVVFVTVCAVALILVVRTPIAKSLGIPDREIWVLPGLYMSAPAAWKLDDNSLHDPDDLVEMRFLSSNAANPIDAITRAEDDRVREHFDRIDISTEHVVILPPGWNGRERALSSQEPNGAGDDQHYRLIIAWKRVRGGLIVMSIEVADSIGRAAPDFFTALVASITVR